MSDPATTPVTAIESIGPRIAERLGGTDVRVVADLHRVPSRRVHRAVDDLASMQQAIAWREMAYLFLVRPVNSQWAEALHGGGVSSIEDLATSRWSELRDLFASARAAGTIPDEPLDGELADMLRDAAELTHTGHLCGRVVDGDGQAVAGAEVRVGTVSTSTDERGLFHLWRLPLGTDDDLEVDAPTGRRFLFEHPPVASDLYLIDERAWRLTDPEPETGRGGSESLSELDGDELPIGSDTPVRVRHLPPGVLREQDVLLLREVDPEDGTAELVSRYRSWEQGTLVVHPVRIPLEDLPAGAEPGVHFAVRGGQLHPMRIDARLLHQLRAGRRAARQAATGEGVGSAEDLADRLRETLSALR